MYNDARFNNSVSVGKTERQAESYYESAESIDYETAASFYEKYLGKREDFEFHVKSSKRYGSLFQYFITECARYYRDFENKLSFQFGNNTISGVNIKEVKSIFIEKIRQVILEVKDNLVDFNTLFGFSYEDLNFFKAL